MSLHDECVLPSVVIEILESNSPARHVSREHAKPCFQFLRAEQSPAVIMKNNVRIMRKLGDKKIGEAIVVIILKNDAHARGHSAALRKRRTRIHTSFVKRTVPVVVKKKLIRSVIGDKNVRESVAVIVRERYPQPVALLRGDAGSDAHVLKRAISPIVIEDVCDGRKRTWRAVGGSFGAARFAFLDAPIQIAGNEQIQPAVVIVIEKSRRSRPTAGGDASLRGDIRKSAVAIVVIQNILSEVGHVDVRKTVIVIIPDRDSHSVV